MCWFRVYLLAGCGLSSARILASMGQWGGWAGAGLSTVIKHRAHPLFFLVPKANLKTEDYHFLCLPDEETRLRVVKYFAPGHTAGTDPGYESHVSWVTSLFSFCPLSVVYSFIPNLFIGSLPDSNLGIWESSSNEALLALGGDSHQQQTLLKSGDCSAED